MYWKNISPEYEGKKQLEQLEHQVQVQFDDFGIPHIKSESKKDAYFTLGYLTAKDRLFQIELMRRVANGELAEIFGESALSVDVMFRTIGLKQAAEKSAAQFLEEAPIEAKNELQAYIDGINQMISEGNLPFEYKLNGFEPKQYTLSDVYSIAGYMAWGFGLAQKTDPLVSELANQHGEDWVNQLFLHPTANDHYVPSFPMLGDTSNLSIDISLYSQIPVPLFHGSNSWAIAGERSASGKPILCNDTHIGYGIPQVWYEAHMDFGNNNIYGNFLPGIPYALVAHNDFLAWGMTMFENDDMDFYQEKVLDQDHYQFREEAIPLKVREEIISIKGSGDTTIVVRESHHGPFIDGRIPELSNFDSDVSMRWEYLKGDNRLLEGFREMNTASSISEFKNGISKIHSPGLNTIYADKDNNIAWWACARLLEWNDHVNTKAILNGSSGDDDPLRTLPFFLNPNQINPPDGIVYSANSQSMQPDSALYPGYYVPESRADLIKKELLEAENWSNEDMKKLLMNTMNEVDLENAQFLEGLLRESKTPFNTLEQMAMTKLRKWDGDYNTESSGASIYQHLHYNLMRAAFLDEIREDQFHQMNRLHWMKRLGIELIRNPEHSIWDRANTEEIETLKDVLDAAFQLTVDQFHEMYGPNPEEWAWGKVHTLEFNHPMAAGGALLKKIYNLGPVPSAGGNETIMQAGYVPGDLPAYHAHFGPQMRIIIDLYDIENAWSITPTGQSARRWSEHYSDQFEMYQNGEYRPMWMTDTVPSSLHKRLLLNASE